MRGDAALSDYRLIAIRIDDTNRPGPRALRGWRVFLPAGCVFSTRIRYNDVGSERVSLSSRFPAQIEGFAQTSQSLTFL
jgi:hypothetical protein